MKKHDVVWQALIIIDDELKVAHRFVALVGQGDMLGANGILWVINLVHNMRDVANIDVQPRRVLQVQESSS